MSLLFLDSITYYLPMLLSASFQYTVLLPLPTEDYFMILMEFDRFSKVTWWFEKWRKEIIILFLSVFFVWSKKRSDLRFLYDGVPSFNVTTNSVLDIHSPKSLNSVIFELLISLPKVNIFQRLKFILTSINHLQQTETNNVMIL